MTDPATPEPRPFRRTLIMSVLLAGAFVAILNETLLNVALPPIMRDFHIAANRAQWLTTAYLLTNGVLIPVSAFLVQKFSTRSLYFAGMGSFALGTLVAGLAPNFTVLLAARVLQASGSAIILPLLMNVVLRVYPLEERGAAMGLMGLVITFAPAVGPTLSGWIVEHHSWHLLFFMVLPFALLDMGFAAVALENLWDLTHPRIDSLSILLSSVGFGGLLYAFSAAGTMGWNNTVVLAALAAAILGLFGLIRRQTVLSSPMLEFGVFRSKMFTLCTAVTILVFMSMFAAMLLLPLYLQNIRGYTPLAAGFLIMPGAVIMGIMSPISGKIFDRVGGRWLGVSGSALLLATMLRFAALSDTTTYLSLLLSFGFMMLGMSLMMMPVMTAGLNQLPPRLYPHGTAMSNTLQQVAGAIGTALLVTVMSTGSKEWMQSLLRHLGGPISNPTHMAQLAEQANLHGMDQAFWVGALFALLALILCFFIRRSSPESAME